MGPTLVYCESKWLAKCPVQFRPEYYHCYVDDIFLMPKKKDHMKKFLSYMNSRHTIIKFRHEAENENKISFLDVVITREEDALTISKKTSKKNNFSSVYLHFDSHLLLDYKKGLIETLLFRADNILRFYKIASKNYFFKVGPPDGCVCVIFYG